MLDIKKTKEHISKMLSTKWVRWVHPGTEPANTVAEKVQNADLGAISNHCAMCLNLNGCCFVKDNCPQMPLHRNCHCYPEDVDTISVTSECAVQKFSEYVFVYSQVDDKKELFEAWGYDIMDSEYLQKEFIRQAKLAYEIGDYELGLLNEYGQRINITITLARRNKDGDVTFRSGWMVYPDGKIVLTTPYGRK